MTQVVFFQGGGEGAHDADAALVASLRRLLGDRYVVSYPTMPNEGDPDYERWKPQFAREIARADGGLILVGHSLGAYMLLRYLSEDGAPTAPRGILLIAAPYPGGDKDWHVPGFSLPADVGSRLPKAAKVFLYHSPDDQTVPFAHMRLYARAIPRAIVRETTGGHQLNNDASVIATDIHGL